MLPQLKAKGILHEFTVFSIIEDDGSVKPKYAQCNNCGLIHKVIDLCKSVILEGKDEMRTLLTKDDLKLSLIATSPDLVNFLDKNDVDLSTWEQIKFTIENKVWGSFITLSRVEEDGLQHIKYLSILGDNLFKVDTYSKQILI